jgi:hypothetical protein
MHRSEEQQGVVHNSRRAMGDIHQAIRGGETTRIYFESQEGKKDEIREQSEYKTGQNHSKLSVTRMKTRQDNTSGSIANLSENRIRLRDECVESDKEHPRVRSNQNDGAAAGGYIDEGVHSKVTHNKSQETPITGHRNVTEERIRDDLSQRGGKEIQTAVERCDKEFFPPVKNPQVTLGGSNSSSNGHTRQIDMGDLESTADLKRLEKIEAIEGWMKLYESEFSNEREQEIDNKINKNETKKVIKHNEPLSTQVSRKAVSQSILSGGTSQSLGTPKVQKSTAS